MKACRPRKNNNSDKTL